MNYQFLFQIAVLGFGLNPVLSKLSRLSPFTIVAGRTIIAFLVILIGAFLLGKSKILKVRLKNLPFLALVGFALASHWFAYFYSIKISTVAIGVLGFATSPVWVALFEPLLEKKSYKKLDVIAAVLVFFGLVLIPQKYGFNDNSFYGLFWSLICGILFAIVSLCNRKIIGMNHTDPIAVSFYEYIFAFPLALLVWDAIGRPDEINARAVSYLFAIGTFGTAVAHTLIIFSLKHISATTANIMLSLHPVYGIILALIFVGEVPNLRMIAGAAIILGTTGSYSFLKSRRSS